MKILKYKLKTNDVLNFQALFQYIWAMELATVKVFFNTLHNRDKLANLN